MKEWQKILLFLGAFAIVIAVIVFLVSLPTTREERMERITEPEYIASCYNSGLGEGQIIIKIKSWRSWQSGFTLYYMDGTRQFFSSGNSCAIEKIKNEN